MSRRTQDGDFFNGFGNLIVAGDGYAYVPYSYFRESHVGYDCYSESNGTTYLSLLRIDTAGNGSSIPLGSWNRSGDCYAGTYAGAPTNVYVITNADQGTMVTWQLDSGSYSSAGQTKQTSYYIATTSGANVVSQSSMNSLVQPVLQAQDGSFYGLLTNGSASGMVKFDTSGKVQWSVPGDTPQIATADNGVVGASGISYDGNGNATDRIGLPTQSWTQNTYEYGSIDKTMSISAVPAIPSYWSFAGANQSSNRTSPLCLDVRDQLIAQYGSHAILDSFFSVFFGQRMNKSPRFAPNCHELTKSAHSANFTFKQINNPGPNAFPPDFDWALIKYPLVAPAATGMGLDKWLEEYGKPRTISSGYRDPVQNGGAGNSRHMLGDAVDFQSITYGQKAFDDMNAAGIRAQADFIENHHEYCAASLHCAHADWRYHYKGDYQH